MDPYIVDPRPFRTSPPSEVVTSVADLCDSSVVPLAFSMTPPPPLSAASLPPPPPALEGEALAAAAAAEARLLAKRRASAAPGRDPAPPYTAADAVADHIRLPDVMPDTLRGSLLSQPYCITSLAEEEEAMARALAKRRSLAHDLRGSFLALQDPYRRLSTADLAAGVDTVADPCAFRNLHFDEPPCAETASTTSAATTLTASRRGSRAGAATPEGLLLGGSRRGSCCHSCQDVIGNRRRVSCYTEGAATPAMYQCNGTRCGESHHCPEAFDDPCCGAAAEDFWVQAYYKEERRKRNKRAKAAVRAAKSKAAVGARRASRAPTPAASKRGSGVPGDLEASKEIVSAADKKRRWVVYICATFVVMLVALAVLMVVVSLSMGNRSKVKASAVTEAATAAAVDELTLSPLEMETSV